ncbi:NHL repeat-containing protein [Undibacterium flavidum]|uniref:NHL repeat-containing protein n=1 Tax=Undibacterium flavidum TaxID=2762297 RepID=A0ABR6YBT2_9BURK|nr:hypothetical protein [Undibacterium flavidum]MBC3874051.1 hypothetical protein [Undibacterium flavidum]
MKSQKHFSNYLYLIVFLLSACGGGETHTVVVEKAVKPTPSLEFVAGSLGGEGNSDLGVGRFYRPVGLAITADGTTYTISSPSGALRKLTPNGQIKSISLLPNDLRWSETDPVEILPRNIVLDKDENVYVGDLENCRIIRVTPSEQVSVFAGSSCGYRDGTKDQAQFRSVGLLAIDQRRNAIYVGDRENHSIRKISPDGQVSTIAGKPGDERIQDGRLDTARFGKLTSIAMEDNILARSPRLVIVDNYSIIRTIDTQGEVKTLTFAEYGSFTGSLFMSSIDLYAMSERGLIKLNNVFDLNYSRNFLTTYDNVTFYDDVRFNPGFIQLGNSGVGYSPGQLAFGSTQSVDVTDGIFFADTFNHALRKIKLESPPYSGSFYSINTFAGKTSAPQHVPYLNFSKFPVPADNSAWIDLPLDRLQEIAVDTSGSIHIDFLPWTTQERAYSKINTQGEITTRSIYKSSFPSAPTYMAPNGAQYFLAPDQIWFKRKVSYGEEFAVLAGKTHLPDDYSYKLINPDPKDGKGENAIFNNIRAHVFDEQGNIYLIDREKFTRWDDDQIFWFSRARGGLVRKVSADGTVTTLAGSIDEHGHVDGPGHQARFHGPMHITRDPQNNLYVADAFNHVIRKIRPDGYVSTFAGTPKVAGDKNGLASQASFNEPNLVCFDKHGNLYVSDSGNFLIRKITPQGQVSNVVGISGIRGVALGKLPTSISFVSGMHVDQNDVMYLYTENSLLKIQL